MKYDVIVIGCGHAGCEAALAASRMGCSTLLLGMHRDAVALMPCNPSVGGPGKAQLVRELDALGGEMALNIDRSSLQTKILNTGKGPAVRALRAQCDKDVYRERMKEALLGQAGLVFREGTVSEVVVSGSRVLGVRTESGEEHEASRVILATGVYMDSRVIAGEESRVSGPDGQAASLGLADSLRRVGLGLVRFKTGTSPRLLRSSLDFGRLKPEWGADPPMPFSFMSGEINRPHLACWLTRTNEATHEIIRSNLDKAPLFTGEITGRGPRYCPSIEDKVVRFPDRLSHQVFLEPEGEGSEEMYVLGMSTSIPVEVQERMVHSVEGLEDALITRPGYAIEYECLMPMQLTHSLEVKGIQGLYAAGQINGTSGYEEAAAQGIIAGINAALSHHGRDPLYLQRSEAFIGVLIDDLVSKGSNEPYRMLTSRAEYRLLLRQDNADLRLTETGYRIGLVSEERYKKALEKGRLVREGLGFLEKKRVRPGEVSAVLEERGSAPVHGATPLKALLDRPEIGVEDLVRVSEELGRYPEDVRYQLEIECKYAGYIQRQKQEVARVERIEGKAIPEWVKYEDIEGLSFEAKQKLSAVRPRSIGEAMRVCGVSLPDVNLILASIGARRKSN